MLTFIEFFSRYPTGSSLSYGVSIGLCMLLVLFAAVVALSGTAFPSRTHRFVRPGIILSCLFGANFSASVGMQASSISGVVYDLRAAGAHGRADEVMKLVETDVDTAMRLAVSYEKARWITDGERLALMVVSSSVQDEAMKLGALNLAKTPGVTKQDLHIFTNSLLQLPPEKFSQTAGVAQVLAGLDMGAK